MGACDSHPRVYPTWRLRTQLCHQAPRTATTAQGRPRRPARVTGGADIYRSRCRGTISRSRLLLYRRDTVTDGRTRNSTFPPGCKYWPLGLSLLASTGYRYDGEGRVVHHRGSHSTIGTFFHWMTIFFQKGDGLQCLRPRKSLAKVSLFVLLGRTRTVEHLRRPGEVARKLSADPPDGFIYFAADTGPEQMSVICSREGAVCCINNAV